MAHAPSSAMEDGGAHAAADGSAHVSDFQALFGAVRDGVGRWKEARVEAWDVQAGSGRCAPASAPLLLGRRDRVGLPACVCRRLFARRGALHVAARRARESDDEAGCASVAAFGAESRLP